MDGWVSDKFYSYFPSYNDEDKKRQASLYEKQLEYERNYIKLINANAENTRRGYNNTDIGGQSYSISSSSQPCTSRGDITYELAGNVASLHDGNNVGRSPVLPGSTRYKLLQDLQHTNLSNMLNDNLQNNYTKNEMITDNRSIRRVVNKSGHEDDQTPTGVSDTHQSLSSRSMMNSERNVNEIDPFVDNNVGKSPVRPGSTRFKLLQDLQHTDLSKIMFNDGIRDRNENSAMSEIEKKKIYQKELIKQIEEKRLQAEKIKEKERLEEEALNRKMELQYKTILLEEELEREKHRTDKIRFDSDQKKLIRDHFLRKLEKERMLLSAPEKETRIKRNMEIKTATSINDRKIYKYFSNSARTEFNRGGRLRSLNTVDFDIPELDIGTPRDDNNMNKFHDINCNSCYFCRLKLKIYETWCLKCNSRIQDKQVIDNRTNVCENCQRIYIICVPCKNVNRICNICYNKSNVCKSCIQNVCIKCGNNVENIRESRNDSNHQRSYTLSQNNNQQLPYFEDLENDEELDDYVKCNKNYKDNVHLKSNNSKEEILDNSQNNIELSVSKFFDINKNFDAIRIDTNDRLSRYMQNYGDLALKRKSNSRSTQTTPKLNFNSNLNDNLMVQSKNEIPLKKYAQHALKQQESNDDYIKKRPFSSL